MLTTCPQVYYHRGECSLAGCFFCVSHRKQEITTRFVGTETYLKISFPKSGYYSSSSDTVTHLLSKDKKNEEENLLIKICIYKFYLITMECLAFYA